MAEYREHIVDMLRQMAEQKKMVAIHENPHDFESFVVGYVQHVTDEQVNFRGFNPRGEDDGILAIHLDQIASIHWDSDYLRRVQYLSEHPITLHPPIASLLSADAESLSSILTAAQESGTMITIHFLDADKLSGLVSSVGEDWVEFEVILDTGQSDGWKIIPFYKIGRLDVGGIEEQVDLAVHRSRYAMGQ